LRLPFSGTFKQLGKLPLWRALAFLLIILITGLALMLRMSYKFGWENPYQVLWGGIGVCAFFFLILIWKKPRSKSED